MAEEKTEKTKAKGRRFQPVHTTLPIVGGARRGDASATVLPTGRVTLNAEASEMLSDLVVAAGGNPKQCFVTFGAETRSEMVAIYPADGGAPGATPVRWHGRSSMVLHIGGVFKQFPQLKVPSIIRCAVRPEVDADGNACLVMALGTGIAKLRRSRGGSGENPSASSPVEPMTSADPEETDLI